MPFAFLTARWSNLCLFTYAVPPDLLLGRLPPGLELDTRPDAAGRAFVSLVAFDFLDTRVLGVPWPGYRNFAELNLRYYVRREGTGAADGGGSGGAAGAGGAAGRGVVFVREFVPQRLVAFLARATYNEPYVAAPLVSRVRETPASVEVEHRLAYAGREHTIAMTGDKPAALAGESSVEHFFKEHRWGYGTTRGGRLVRYEVVHPHWHTYPVRSWRLDLDWAATYGREWAFLRDAMPYSTLLAVGSGVSVFPKSRWAGEVVEAPSGPLAEA